MLGLGLRWLGARRRRFTATWGLWLGRKLIEGEERAGVLPIEAGGCFYRSSRGSTLMVAGRSLSGRRWRSSSASMEILPTRLDPTHL